MGANFLFSFSSGHPFTTVYAPPGGQVDPYIAGVDYMFDTRNREALEPIGSSRTPWQFNVDLRLDKTFMLMKKMEITLYARVLNLFNTRNELNVYQITGSARDDGFLYNPERSKTVIDQIENTAHEQYGITGGGETYAKIYQAMNLDNAGSYNDQVGLEMFGRPRQIFFGIKLAY